MRDNLCEAIGGESPQVRNSLEDECTDALFSRPTASWDRQYLQVHFLDDQQTGDWNYAWSMRVWRQVPQNPLDWAVVREWPHAQEDIVSYDDQKDTEGALREELEVASGADSIAIEESLRSIDRLKVDDDVTLREKMGWSELSASVTYKKLKVGAMVRDLFRKDEESGAIRAYVKYDVGRFGLSPFVQYFRGYGETLLRHTVFEDQRVDVGAQIRFR